MVYFHEFDYIFAFGIIFAFLDAWNIGANDVANAFATSVSSRSLSLLQAMLIATVMEFGGAIGVGGKVADTIRTKVVSPSLYDNDPAVLMLGMTCALIGSAIYLTIATRLSMPVSTTHSIMGGVIGMAIATVGAGEVNWGWDGVASVFAAWAIAPGLAGAFGATIFLITKYGVMQRSNPVKFALFSIPFYFALTSGMLTMLIVWKGAAARIEPSNSTVIGSILGTAGGVALLIVFFFIPFLHRKLVQGDWTLKWYHAFLGPFLLRRGEVPPRPEGVTGVQDFYFGHHTKEQLAAFRAQSTDPERDPKQVTTTSSEVSSSMAPGALPAPTSDHKDLVGPKPNGPLTSPKVLFWYIKFAFLHGVNKDVVNAQAKKDLLSGDLAKVHAAATRYDNNAEYVYSFLQVMTAATASFVHGANDVSNAVGPFATIYAIWSTSDIPGKKAPVPYWILAFGGGAIVVGLWTYGYNIMCALGNKITLHSPSRGFSMELGSAVTVVMATQLKLPISTTQCITGATVGVGLCNGNWRAINWRMVAWIYFGWFITLPVTGLISGCLTAIILYGPRFSS